jgi:hypothetical protein
MQVAQLRQEQQNITEGQSYEFIFYRKGEKAVNYLYKLLRARIIPHLELRKTGQKEPQPSSRNSPSPINQLPIAPTLTSTFQPFTCKKSTT